MLESSGEKPSSLLILSHDRSEYESLIQILGHYLPYQPSHDSQTQSITQSKEESIKLHQRLHIENKYYKALIKCSHKKWDEITAEQKQNQESLFEHEEKMSSQSGSGVDFLIMMVSTGNEISEEVDQREIPIQRIDQIVQRYKVEEYLILVNTSNKNSEWYGEQVVMDKCNNFIEIVKEDLSKVGKLWPKWSKGALLGGLANKCEQNEEEDQQFGEAENDQFEMGVFSILDRMETTRWSNLVDKVKQSKSQQVKNEDCKEEVKQENQSSEAKCEKAQKAEQSSRVSGQNMEGKESGGNDGTSENEQQQQQEGYVELSEDQLEAEMQEFESMMGQMVQFKQDQQNTQMSDSQRKQRAEDLFSKLMGGNI